MNPEGIFYALINIYANGMSASWVAEKVGFSRNTINTYKKKFAHLKDDIIDFIQANPKLTVASPSQLKKSAASKAFIKRHDIRSHLRICNYEIEAEIKGLCETYLNYYIFQKNPYAFACKRLEHYAEKLWSKHSENSYLFYNDHDRSLDIIKRHIFGYPDRFPQIYNQYNIPLEFDDKKCFMVYKKDISDIHYYLCKPHPVPKNYKEVYEEYKSQHPKTHHDSSRPISYSAFFNIASQFWGKEKYVYSLFEDLKFVDGDDEYDKIQNENDAYDKDCKTIDEEDTYDEYDENEDTWDEEDDEIDDEYNDEEDEIDDDILTLLFDLENDIDDENEDIDDEDDIEDYDSFDNDDDYDD